MITVALLTAHNAPLMLTKLEPMPLQYGQVLVKVLASGICGAQLQEIDGSKMGGPLPHPLGHEGCVEVVEVGPAVRQVKVGDRCVAHWRKGDGIESEYPKYLLPSELPLDATWPDVSESSAGRIITSGKVTTFSDYSVCSENRLTTVPSDTPVELCALLGCGLSTALGTIESEAQLLMGETVLIIGCGGLGLNLILAAKMRQATRIDVFDIQESKEASAFSAGCTQFYHYQGQVEYMARPYDVIIDTSGNEESIRFGLCLLAPSGRFIMVGQPRPGVSVPINNARHLFDGEGCSIKATQGGMFRPSVDIPRYVRLHQAGLLNLNGIISHRVSLENINDGIDLVRNGQAGRVLIIP